MIRQLCPSCVQLVELPDDAAGETVVCPRCAHPFPVPQAYTPTVDTAAGPPAPMPPAADRPAPPPGFVPPQPPGTPVAPPPPAGATAPPVPVPTPAGYTHSGGFALTPQALGWVPAACLTVVLALSFFPWVGSYPGGVRLYSQMPWQAAFGYFTPSPLGSADDELALKSLVSMNWLLVLYVLLLLPAVALAWSERFVRGTNPTPTNLPGPLARLAVVWPQRFLLLTVLTGLLLALLLVQTWRGFGLEQAVDALAARTHEKEVSEADTLAKEQRAQVRVGQEVGRFALDGTTALNWAIAAHVVAVASVVGLWWLHRRGPKPAPQVRAYW